MTFETEFARLMTLTKSKIANELVDRGFLAPSARDYVVKNYTKVLLARRCADQILRMEARGY